MTKFKNITLFAAVLAAVLFLSGLLALRPVTAAAAEDSQISAYCPDGATNISLGKQVTASSSYEMQNEGWAASFLTDGKLPTPGQNPNGWTTAPGETTDARKIAWACIDLGGEYRIDRIVLFPRSDHANDYGECFPVDFQLQTAPSSEGPWTDVKNFTGFAKPTEPLKVDLTDASGSFVRLYVTGRTGVDNMTGGGGGNDGKLVQLSEMAVFGSLLHAAAALNKPALELKVGASERLTLTVTGAETPALTWKSDDSAVAEVSQDGTVTAKGLGKTVIRVSGEGIGEKTIPVSVVEKKNAFDDNITISVFWLPTKSYLSGGAGDERWDEQFKLLADADVDWLAHVTDNENTGMLLETKEDNLKAAKYADKYGLELTVADKRFGRNLLNMTDEEIASLVEEYRNVPGVGGYYIWDEPGPTENLGTFARVYAAMKKADPDAYAHLNFLPMMAYPGGEEAYRAHVQSWLAATERAGVEQDYIMYDFYPYTGFGSDMDRNNFFSHLDAMRKLGLENGVKTATYLQSNGSNSKRSPSPAEIRYQAMTSLAYGYKQLSYFTWFLPTERGSEVFRDSIVSDRGVPNPVTYDAVAKLNKEIHTLGKTLVNLDAEQVYLNGDLWGGQQAIPDTFVFQSTDDISYTVSLLKDKRTGRNYVMLVNNDFKNPMTTNVFVPAVSRLQRISPADGSLEDVEIPADDILEITLEAGDAVLYALPEGLDYTEEQTVDRTAAEAVLARAENEKKNLSEDDAAALDAVVGELKDALYNAFAKQSYVDDLTAQAEEILARATPSGDAGDGPSAPDPDGSGGGSSPDDSGGSEDTGGGCGSVIGLALGGALSLSLLLFAASLVFFRKRKN